MICFKRSFSLFTRRLIMFALNHPEKSFPWNNTITWLLYGVYFLVTVVLLIAPKIKK